MVVYRYLLFGLELLDNVRLGFTGPNELKHVANIVGECNHQIDASLLFYKEKYSNFLIAILTLVVLLSRKFKSIVNGHESLPINF